MSREDPAEERRRFELIGGAIAVVVVATIIGFFVAVIWRSSADELPPPATPAPTASEEPTDIGDTSPRLLGPVEVRSAPAPNVAIVTRAAETEAIRVLGRSPSGEWLAISLIDRSGVSGWVLAPAVAQVDLSSLPVIEGSGATGTPRPDNGTFTPDLPDLVIERVFAQENRLTVRLANYGVTSATGLFHVSVNGQDPIELDVKPGEALRPGQTLDAAIPGVFVQLRSPYSIELLSDPERPEEDSENNRWDGIVAPDQPIDLEIVDASVRDDDGVLLVTVRNNSSIPIVGSFTVTVREALPSTVLLGRIAELMEIAADESVEFVFENLIDADLTRITISLSSNDIDDAALANNTYPR